MYVPMLYTTFIFPIKSDLGTAVLKTNFKYFKKRTLRSATTMITIKIHTKTQFKELFHNNVNSIAFL